jgi:DNA-binding protein YbaB
MLQDLIVSACREAAARVDEEVSKKMSGFTGGLKIPGL